MIWFYRCGTDPAETTEEDATDSSDKDPPFSYRVRRRLYLLRVYAGLRPDLRGIPPLVRSSAFRSLPEETQLVKIIGYRTMKIPAKASKEQRQHYEHLKRVYALPQSADRQQLESDLNSLLMNGGNPAVLLTGGEGHGIRRDSEI